ncbi:hypothetical protein RFI_08779 [Reticulomyxa filosa]|uniref:Uncharacterized protein n=1 Tax=Reticulomyxa filosa TaxID=46433 RepID=X6NR13_RETFI|nr:hypothetical protein RFI_08779 [Reticulomyxa filosa]|eukprot:ETO28353.1 hypothetical protein RFI_08779 [Reticulomyxa filosa]
MTAESHLTATNETKVLQKSPRTATGKSLQQQIIELQTENEQMKQSIRNMHLQLQQQKLQNQSQKEKLKLDSEKAQWKLEHESKVSELHQLLTRAKNELNDLLTQQKTLKVNIEKQQNIILVTGHSSPKKSEQERTQELKQKLDSLQKKYDDLTEQKNDLLVYLVLYFFFFFIGYLHDEQEKMQNKLNELVGGHSTYSSTTIDQSQQDEH